MRKVIERVFDFPDDPLEDGYKDVESSYEKAESIAGITLDKRKNYCIIKGKVCEAISYTHVCSGCEGGGCHECGYQGKVVNSFWSPLYLDSNREDK